MNSGTSIQLVKPSDLHRVLEIQDVCGLSPWTHRDYMDELLRTDSIFLKAADTESNCRGFLIGRKVPGSGELREFELYNIGVDPLDQNEGIGSGLIEELFFRCRSDRVACIWLDVRRSNTHAIGFYKKHGFVEVSARKDFYTSPAEDALVFRRELIRDP